MFWTVVFGVIFAVVILAVIAAIWRENPGCAALILGVILLLGLARCVF